MQSGIINKIAITQANVTDAKGLKHVCPDKDAIYANKGYCTKPAQHTVAKQGVHLAAIMMNHMLAKNHDKDRWFSHLYSMSAYFLSVTDECDIEVSTRINSQHLWLPSVLISSVSWCLSHLVLFLLKEGYCAQKQIKPY